MLNTRTDTKDWKRISLHNHTRKRTRSAYLKTMDLIMAAVDQGYDGVAITDHQYRHTGAEILHIKERALNKGYCKEDFLIFSGMELSLQQDYSGGKVHALVFGYDKAHSKSTKLSTLCDAVHDGGGAVIIAHPALWHKTVNRFWRYDADGIEVLHPDQYNQDVFEYMKGRQNGFALIGSDDAHSSGDIGQYCTLFPPDTTTEAKAIEAIKTGHVYPCKRQQDQFVPDPRWVLQGCQK